MPLRSWAALPDGGSGVIFHIEHGVRRDALISALMTSYLLMDTSTDDKLPELSALEVDQYIQRALRGHGVSWATHMYLVEDDHRPLQAWATDLIDRTYGHA